MKSPFEALRALQSSAQSPLERALASADPVAEIAQRLDAKPDEAMSTPEKVFWAVTWFVEDALDEGMSQALTGEAGDVAGLFVEFVARYGDAELKAIAEALTPSGAVSADRKARAAAVASIGDEALDALTERLRAAEPAIEAALIALVRNNIAAFDLRES